MKSIKTNSEKIFGISDKDRAARIVSILKEIYPEAVCALEYKDDPWKLLVQGRLSAQCTDKRVNIVSVPLFERYPTAYDMAVADFDELAEIIRPCGLYRTKAQNLIDSSRIICEKYGGKLPSEMEELLFSSRSRKKDSKSYARRYIRSPCHCGGYTLYQNFRQAWILS